MRRSMMGRKKLQLFTKRFYPAGNYTWIVPKGCREVDVFLSEEGVQDIMEAVEVAAILKPSKQIQPDGETVMLSLLHRVSQFR